MPRIAQHAAQYAEKDFLQDIRSKQGFYGLRSDRELAQAAGIPSTTLHPKMQDPNKFSVADLRKIIPVVHPDPGVLLILLGYSSQEVKKFQKAGRGSTED